VRRHVLAGIKDSCNDGPTIIAIDEFYTDSYEAAVAADHIV
jgi:hypothetical protein